MNREPIYAALFGLVSGVPGIVTASRRLKHWNDVPAVDQPALFQIQKGETGEQAQGLPMKWTLAAEIYLYVNSGDDPAGIPATELNNLLDLIELALAPNFRGVQTLGGLVSHCWISGRIETDEGSLGSQAVAIIPISITVGG